MQPAAHGATLADLLAVSDEKPYFELLEGELSQKAAPLFSHGDTQFSIGEQVRRHFRGPPGGDKLGGWWIGGEVHVELAPNEVVVPDVVGWRIDRLPEPPAGFPVKSRPDWICEVASPSSPSRDTVRKLRMYHRAGVPHYWIADPDQQTLTVFRWQPEGYLVVLTTQPPEQVRPEPFEAVEYSVAALLGVGE
ncbi:Uma2 family endonuclease [Nannocystis bainbridge]|uniref:Uma2 family endonuclease n=1 Tax=Nannocystis bainbridge TaxID=2995303 RepID=A0ABT5EBW7_9BACT|nr:Uma2 family endonuclease [Nannocystis bainbridge]MDC0722281.1 Uma2 family endonuclease [Nannocystis bainbridge]